jgi:hypothetical protein
MRLPGEDLTARNSMEDFDRAGRILYNDGTSHRMSEMSLRCFHRTSWVLACALLLSACGARSPYLKPATSGAESSPEAKQVVVEITPVDTSGFRNSERERLGIDLSAYFTAFEVKIRNQTTQSVVVDGQGAQLFDDDQKSYPALSYQESLDYYRSGGLSDEKMEIIPKSSSVSKEEIEKIRELRLKGGEMASGGTQSGVLFFRKVPPDKCHHVSLNMNGVRIFGEDQSLQFWFTFSCSEA